MKITVLYVGSSLLAPLKNAEREINRDYNLEVEVIAYNFGSPLSESEWKDVRCDLGNSDLVFVIHVMDGENASRLIPALKKNRTGHRAVIVINCMPELMRLTRMGGLSVERFFAGNHASDARGDDNEERKDKGTRRSSRAITILSAAGSWVGKQARGKQGDRKSDRHGQYLKLVDRLPAILRFVPNAGSLRDVKNYLYLFCYFLQPTPANIRSMLLYAAKHYVVDEQGKPIKLNVPPPERMPSVAIYHPDSAKLFESFDAYRKWYRVHSKSATGSLTLESESTVGLLLMRPQVVSKTTKHYDALIHALEAEGLSVIPALSTLMDNRQACEKFFLSKSESKVQPPTSKVAADAKEPPVVSSRVSQIVSLTGFSFVGGPAMNDSHAAAEFLTQLGRPYRSAVSLDMQSIEAWSDSRVGLNPVQAGMQIAIPEIDGATEPFVYGGIPARGIEPVALEDRCRRLARRIRRWNRLRTASREELKLALVLFCFPPNKGNIGTAADLDVFPSVWETLHRLRADGYQVEVPQSADELRERLLTGNSDRFAAAANVAYGMTIDEYRANCPYVDEIEESWGPPPGKLNSFGGKLLIQGLQLGNIFIGVQPTFGFEGDPMRLMMARGSTPHHGFMAFYSYLTRILDVDGVIHVGTHGAMEFMPGKQLGLSGECWPDRLIGELPNLYLYSVNNPSEGSIAKRRSYAELISYLTPPIENAGLYKDLSSLKDLLNAYRQSGDENEKERLFESIEECSRAMNFEPKLKHDATKADGVSIL